MKTIKIQNPTSKTMRPFGTVIGKPQSKPTGHNELLDYWKQQARFKFPSGAGEVGYLIARKHPGVYTLLETHLETPEILVPLNCGMNILVAPAATRQTDVPDIAKAKAFFIRRGQAVMLNKGVWHWLPQPVGKKEAHILVIFSDNTSRNDYREGILPEPVKIVG